MKASPCRSSISDVACVALPAFGAGVLLTLFLPPCVLVGVSALLSVGFGVACLVSGKV